MGSTKDLIRYLRGLERNALRFDTHVMEKILRTPEIMSLRFERPAEFDYLPGQYIFVTVTSGNEKQTKHLTISSSPTEMNHLEVTKRLTGHPFANTLSSLNVGDTVTLDGAYGSGDFTFKFDIDKVLFLTGGIGVTPFRSMIRYCFDKCLSNNIVLLYSNRYDWDIAFREEFDKIQQQSKNIRVIYTVTRPTGDWHGLTGRVDAEMISVSVKDWHDRVTYVSGPKHMVDDMLTILKKGLGLERGSVKYQYFPGFEDINMNS